MNSKYYLNLFLFLFFVFSADAQLSKKSVKTIETQIEKSYELNDFESVIFLVNQLKANNQLLKANLFEYWFNSVYKFHDLREVKKCSKYYDRFIKGTKGDKKISAQSKYRLESFSNIFPLFIEGENHLKNKSYSEAADVFNKINEIDSIYWQVHFNLSYIYANLGDYQSVFKHSNISLKWNPEAYKLNYLLAYAQFQLKDYDATIITVDKLIEMDEADGGRHELKAHAYFQMGLYQKAIESINRAIQINANQIEYYGFKYSCELKMNNSLGIINSLVEILKIDTLNSAYINTASKFINEVDDRGRLLAVLDSTIYKYPNELNLKLLRINHLSSIDSADYKKGLPIYDDIINSDTNNAYYHFLKGEFIFNAFNQKKTRKDQAYSHLLKANELDPFYYKTYDYLCRLFMWNDAKVTKKYKKLAIKNMYAKIEKDVENPDAYFELAKAYDLPINGYGSGMKYKDSVLRYYELSMLKGMDSLKVMLKRSYVFVQLNMHEECIESYEWLLTQTKNSAVVNSAVHYIPRSYRALKQYGNEKCFILKALKNNGNNISLKKRLIEVEQLMKRKGIKQVNCNDE